MYFLIALLSIFTFVSGQYEGYKVYKVSSVTKKQNELLFSSWNDINKVDFWSTGIYQSNVMIGPEYQQYFMKWLKMNNIKYEVVINDIQQLFKDQRMMTILDGDISWTSYYKLESIYSWMDALAKNYSSRVKIISGGISFEGRDIKGLKISTGEGRRAVFIEGGAHAREWISPATVTYIINELLTSNDIRIKKIVNSFDWYIFPSINPDGYVYSYSKFNNRLWRKTRRLGSPCLGVDLNRNFDFHWGEHRTSKDNCNSVYGGDSAFSEKETLSLSNFISQIGNSLDVFLSFHSFGQHLLIPFGNTTEHLSNYDDLFRIGKKAAEALHSKHGTEYSVGSIGENLYLCSGTSTDWVKDKYNVPITYMYEVRDAGKFGFFLPASQIKPNCEEIMESLIAMFEEAEKLNYFKLT